MSQRWRCGDAEDLEIRPVPLGADRLLIGAADVAFAGRLDTAEA